ncbi:glucose dehydrogenase [FAD, quinone] [Megalopta genalis]|uniref:glucose dehydrogenase [FAD, quinone] n=1 Tax=Megalopta genalis TaxID=115081 RepID=UPI003FD30258
METCMSASCNAALSPLPTSLFSQLVNVLLLSQCALDRSADYPPDRTADILLKKDFDFVIVGGGTAGSVVARRLAEVDDWDVLLIEAGKDASPTSEVPGFLMTLPNTAEDYAYKTEQQPGVCQGNKNKRCGWHKGKALGGSSVINAMLHAFGNDRDYNQWEEQGNEGWGYENMLRYLRKATNCPPEYIAEFGDRHCGTNGPMSIRSYNYSDTIQQELFLDAAREMGVGVLEPVVSDRYIGLGRAFGTMDNGERMNAAKAFLSPIRNKKNLYVMKSTRADKVLLKDDKAVGVRVTSEGLAIDITASKEVILSAGSIASPQLLMLSGIGPKKHLEDMGIQIVADLPVGKNLQDHVLWPGILISYVNETTAPPSSSFGLDLAYNYLVHKAGELAAVCVNLMGFANLEDLGLDSEKPYAGTLKYPDIQFHFGHFPRWIPLKIASVYDMVNAEDEIVQEVTKMIMEGDIVLAASTLLQPKSRGVLELRSTDPADSMKIYANYLAEREDLEILLKSVDFIKALTQTPTLKKYNMTLRHFNLPGCRDKLPDSREYWECNIRQIASSVYHHVGTAKMGTKGDPTAVVDSRLRVHGVQRLRVIDASIMPNIVSGNTNSPTMAIAEKGADMMKEDWLENYHNEL